MGELCFCLDCIAQVTPNTHIGQPQLLQHVFIYEAGSGTQLGIRSWSPCLFIEKVSLRSTLPHLKEQLSSNNMFQKELPKHLYFPRAVGAVMPPRGL